MILMSWPAVSWPSRYEDADQQDREQHEVVGHAVAHRLAEDVDRDRANRAHASLLRLRRARPRPTSVTRCTKKSSSVSRSGLSETTEAPAATSSEQDPSGGWSSDSSSA